MRTTAICAVTCAMLLPACNTVSIEASGSIVAETRDVAAFDEIDASQGVVVRLTVEPGAVPVVTVNYDDNLIDHVVTEVRGDALRLRLDANVNSRQGAERYVEVVVPELESVTVGGGAVISASGRTDALELAVSSGAVAEMASLDVGRLDVDLSGGAVALVTATEAIDGEASGGALLTVVGDPANIDVATSGGALIGRQ